MKKTTLIIAILLCTFSLQSFAQKKDKLEQEYREKRKQDSIILAFPDFVDGEVYFRNQTKNNAKLNYNHYKQELLFLSENEDKEQVALKVDNMSEIFLVVMEDRSFIPIGNALGELLVDDVVGLICSKKVNAIEKKVGAYGTGGSTASISKLNSIDGGTQGSSSSGRSGGGATTGAGTASYSGLSGGSTSASASGQLFSSDIELKNDERLFLMQDIKVYPLTKKNLLKRFSSISGFINQYIKDNKPDFSSKDDMIKLVSICNGQTKIAKSKK